MLVRPLLLVAATGLGLAAQEPIRLEYRDLLLRLTDPDLLWRPPPAGETGFQCSSYDRRSASGPGDPEAFYANGDRGHYLRMEERDGRKEYVMADVPGPGCVVRIWSANPGGRLSFEVDGEPPWEVDFAALCSGTMAACPDPLAGMRARGGNCHLPIPFQKRLVVRATQGDLYYHVNVVRFAAGTEVPPFSAALLEREREAIAAAAARLRSGPQPEDGSVSMSSGGKVAEGSLVRCVKVWFEDVPAGAELGELLRRILLVVHCGDEETVRVPVSDFFGGAPDWRPHQGCLLGITGNGEGYCRLPMPMPHGGTVELVAEGDLRGLKPRLELAVERLPEGKDPLLLRASFHLRKDVPTRPFHDHLVLDARGRGRYVGCALMVKNPVKGWWGEGDEKFRVDGEAFPSTFGTGTEDYFGYAWCDTALFSSALHAQAQCDGPGNYGFTALNRIHTADAVPFQDSFRFDLEVWHWVEKIAMDYATVAYWYGAPGAVSGLPPLPPADQRSLDRLVPYPLFAVPGVLEGEALRVISCSGGRHRVQELSSIPGLSREEHRWWMDGEPGDRLVLAVPVAAAGRYRVFAQFCKAADYGVVQPWLGGSKLGPPIDLWNDGVVAGGELELGTVELRAGEAELVLEVVGSNERAVPRRMVGLDYLRLRPVE